MRRITVFTALTLIVFPYAAAAVDGSKCDAARILAAVGLAKMSLTCHAKAARLGEEVNADCLAKSEAKFAELYAKAAKPADCTGPAPTDATLSGMVDGIVTAFAAIQRPQDDANLCAGRKLQGIATGTLAQGKCEAIAAKKALAVDAQCTATAGTKFDSAFVKAESKAASQGVPCLTTGDSESVLFDIRQVVGDLSGEIYDPPFTPTPTPVVPCSGSAPACGGACPFPAQVCEPTGAGGCRCVDNIDDFATPTATFTGSATHTGTATRTPPRTPTATITGSATMTPVPPCSGSAPACGGACPFPAQVCEPNGTGGCRCVNIISP